jgi:hypothetical protein
VSVRVEFDFDRDDFAGAVLAKAQKHAIRPWQWVLLAVLVALVLALMAALTLLSGDLTWLNDAPFVLPLLYTAAGVFTLLFLALGARAAIRSWVRSRPRDDGAILGWHAVEVDDDGFHEETRHGKSSVTWSGVLSVRDESGFVFLDVDRGHAHAIPSRAFSSDEDRRAFVDFVATHMTRRG